MDVVNVEEGVRTVSWRLPTAGQTVRRVRRVRKRGGGWGRNLGEKGAVRRRVGVWALASEIESEEDGDGDDEEDGERDQANLESEGRSR